MIRNVCIHVNNEQPLLADLFGVPTATDSGLLCTNLRMLDGKRPVFVDRIEATFFFPYHVIRFVEIPVGALEGHGSTSAGGSRDGTHRDDTADEGLIPEERRLPVPVKASPGADDLGDEPDLEIDEGFLQRIRDI